MIIISKIKQRPETGEDSVSNVSPNTESSALERDFSYSFLGRRTYKKAKMSGPFMSLGL